MFSTSGGNQLKEFCQILDHIAHTPLLVQKEVNVSARTFLSHLAYSISCARFVESRLSLFKDNEPFILAAMLDRRFKMRLYKPGKFEEINYIVIVNVIEKIINMFESIYYISK